MDGLRPGEITRHFFTCPHCDYSADLETHRCMRCGAEVKFILWGAPTIPVSPELVMVSR
jgi:hypothetical protein